MSSGMAPRGRLVALALVGAALLLGLAACNAAEETSPDSEGSEALSGDLEVTHTLSGAELEAFEDVVAGFSDQHPELNVQLESVPFADYEAQIGQRFITDDPPDVLQIFPGQLRRLVDQNGLEPLDDMWDEWIEDGAYTESLRRTGEYNGQTYGIWFRGNVNSLMWHRPDKLDALGLSEPETWDEFIVMLDDIEAQGEEPVTVGGADAWPLTQWHDAILARVGGPEAFEGLQTGEIGWDDPRVVESFEVLADLMENYFPPDALDRGFIESTCALVDGRAVLQNQGAFVNLIAPEECDPDLQTPKDLTFFRLPKYREDDPEVQFISGATYAVAADTAHPEAARELGRYLGSAEGQEIWAERGGFIAPNANVDLDVYPEGNDRKAAELWPRDPDTAALYNLSDFIGGEIQDTLRDSLQRLVQDHDVDRLVATMVEVDESVRGD